MDVALVDRSLEVLVVFLHERVIQIRLELFGGHRQCAGTNRIDRTIAWVDASLCDGGQRLAISTSEEGFSV